jgi:hypothetical protein
MKINRNSWHYKLIKEWDSSTAYDLKYNKTGVSFCKYFWSVMLCFPKILAAMLLIALGVAVLIGCAVFLVIYPLNFLLIGLFDIVLFNDPNSMGPAGLFVALLIALFIGIMETMDNSMKVVPSYLKRTKVPLEPSKEKKPSLLWEYIKAKKAKMCPLVTLDN